MNEKTTEYLLKTQKGSSLLLTLNLIFRYMFVTLGEKKGSNSHQAKTEKKRVEIQIHA